MGAQWLNISVFDLRPFQAVASSSITGDTLIWAYTVYLYTYVNHKHSHFAGVLWFK